MSKTILPSLGLGVVVSITVGLGCAALIGLEPANGSGGAGGMSTASAGGGSGGSATVGAASVTASSSSGIYVGPPSCDGLASTCGPEKNESCCVSPQVTGGPHNRNNDTDFPANVRDFRLDRFEITVGRFRAFVKAYDADPGSKPQADAGEHPLIPGSGWDASWPLPADAAALREGLKCNPTRQTWTDAPGANETLPINCVDWFTAFAFCAWDGGRLPTEAEWDHVSAGGNEQRDFPWPDRAAPPFIDSNYASYDCMGDGSEKGICAFTDILRVGSKSPTGDSRWGQADLGGNVWEWMLDSFVDPYPPGSCDDCAVLSADSPVHKSVRGGSWESPEGDLVTSNRDYDVPENHNFDIGIRCARSP